MRKTYTAKEIAELKRRRFRGPDAWECAVTEQDIEVARVFQFFEHTDEYDVGETMRADAIAAIYDHAEKEQRKRDERIKGKRDERKRAAVEARKAAPALFKPHRKLSADDWRKVLVPVAERVSDLTIDQLVQHFQDIEGEFADMRWQCKANASNMVWQTHLALHFSLLAAREKRIALERRVEALETDHVRTLADCYRGAWRASESYRRGDLVSHGGCAWLALKDNEAQPGDGSDSGWRMIVKKGRDARKDGESK